MGGNITCEVVAAAHDLPFKSIQF